MIRRLYNWTLSLAHSPYALWALAAVAFIESSVFPIPPDLLMIPMIIAAPRRAFVIAGVATVASVLGGVLGYGIGIAHLWMQRALWLREWRGLALSIAGVHAGFGLNLFWGRTVFPNLIKATRRALKSQPSAKQRVD